MIVFIYGTTAEAIKLAPIARRLRDRGVPFQQWLTFQHTEALEKILPTLGLPPADVTIARGNRGKPLRGYGDVLVWLWDIRGWMWKNIRPLRRSLDRDSIVIVHGDTMTSVVGAWIARRLQLPSAHVEAGLRSGNWRHPFPEELDRRIVGRLATVHYAPSEESRDNLARRSNVVLTHGNTVVDSVLDRGPSDRTEEVPYGVVLLHRFEFISAPAFVEHTLRRLDAESPVRMKLLVDAYSRATIEETLTSIGATRLEIQPKLGHAEFVALLRGAEFVVTDSGGIQEESALLGVPTLVHRKATERSEGIGTTTVLSDWDDAVVSAFLTDYRSRRRPEAIPAESPSDIIVTDLAERGFAR